jgi:formylglycine-generating enzyme required for sulfatase activity
MVYVPEGSITRDGGTIHVGAFCLDRLEVTTASFRKCVREMWCNAVTDEAFGCNYASEREEDPMTCVGLSVAEGYCRYKKRRLPTAREWEYAARGPDDLLYPWGNDEPKDQPCWSGGPDGTRRSKGTCVAGSHPKDVSWVGALDLGGNVIEWTLREPAEAKKGQRGMARGGTWVATFPQEMMLSRERDLQDDTATDLLGFRCAQRPSSEQGK